MVPVITINGQQLTLSQIRLLRKCIISYMTWLSEVIWEYVEKSDPDMASLPGQRTHCHKLLDKIDGVNNHSYYAEIQHHPSGVVINDVSLPFAYGEIVRMVLSSVMFESTSVSELNDRDAMLRMIVDATKNIPSLKVF